MEVVAGGERAGGPFSRRNVQEWSKLDQLTGLLEHARVETDHWATSTSNSSHHFGKVSPTYHLTLRFREREVINVFVVRNMLCEHKLKSCTNPIGNMEV